MRPRRAHRTDGNHSTIADYFTGAGCLVHSTAPLGNGFPDLLVYWPRRGTMKLIEVKDGSLPPSRQKLTDDEHDFHARWKGAVRVVASIAQAMAVLQELDRG